MNSLSEFCWTQLDEGDCLKRDRTRTFTSSACRDSSLASWASYSYRTLAFLDPVTGSWAEPATPEDSVPDGKAEETGSGQPEAERRAGPAELEHLEVVRKQETPLSGSDRRTVRTQTGFTEVRHQNHTPGSTKQGLLQNHTPGSTKPYNNFITLQNREVKLPATFKLKQNVIHKPYSYFETIFSPQV